jgi:hypothetical protein
LKFSGSVLSIGLARLDKYEKLSAAREPFEARNVR